MPVQQVIPNVQDNSGDIWAKAIEQLGQIGANAYSGYAQSKQQAGHNDRVYAQAVKSVQEIAAQNKLDDNKTADLLKQIVPDSSDAAWTERDDPKYEAKVQKVIGPLYMWSELKKTTGVDLPLPDTNLDLQTNLELLKNRISSANEQKARSSLLGNPGAASAPTPAPQTLQSLTTPTVLTQTAGQDLTKPNTANMAPEMTSLVNPPSAAPNTLAQTASVSPEIEAMISRVPTDEGKVFAKSLSQQFKQGLISSTDFLKEYNSILKESGKTASELNKVAKEAQMKMFENREVLGPDGKPKPVSLADMSNPDVQFGGKLPTESINTNYNYTNKQPKPVPERSPEQYNQIYKEVQTKNEQAIKNGETPTFGVPEIALSIMDSDPKITSDKARQLATKVLPAYEISSSIFKEDIVPKDQLLKFITLATQQGFDSNQIYKELLNKFGDKLGAVK